MNLDITSKVWTEVGLKGGNVVPHEEVKVFLSKATGYFLLTFHQGTDERSVPIQQVSKHGKLSNVRHAEQIYGMYFTLSEYNDYSLHAVVRVVQNGMPYRLMGELRPGTRTLHGLMSETIVPLSWFRGQGNAGVSMYANNCELLVSMLGL